MIPKHCALCQLGSRREITKIRDLPKRLPRLKAPSSRRRDTKSISTWLQKKCPLLANTLAPAARWTHVPKASSSDSFHTRTDGQSLRPRLDTTGPRMVCASSQCSTNESLHRTHRTVVPCDSARSRRHRIRLSLQFLWRVSAQREAARQPPGQVIEPAQCVAFVPGELRGQSLPL
jgi:hypothetical protein